MLRRTPRAFLVLSELRGPVPHDTALDRMARHAFTLFADYHQFYIQDESADGDLSDAWSQEAEQRLLAVAPGVVGIGTARNVEVPVALELLEHEPPLEQENYDHIVECSLLVESGRIVIAGCTDYFPDAPRLQASPGTYRVRACYSGLGSISEDGSEGSDSYLLQLWEAPSIEPTVLKSRVV